MSGNEFPNPQKVQLGLTSSTARKCISQSTKGSVWFDIIHCKEMHFPICKQVPSSLVFSIDAISFTDFLDDFYFPHESVDWHSTIAESWISFQ